MGRVIQVEDALGGITSYTFDPNGWVASMTLPGGSIGAEYERNSLSQLTKIIDPNLKEWLYAYDPQGRRTFSTDPLGRTTTYTYDSRNRVGSFQFPNGIGDLSVTYSGTGHATKRMYFGIDDIEAERVQREVDGEYCVFLRVGGTLHEVSDPLTAYLSQFLNVVRGRGEMPVSFERSGRILLDGLRLMNATREGNQATKVER